MNGTRNRKCEMDLKHVEHQGVKCEKRVDHSYSTYIIGKLQFSTGTAVFSDLHHAHPSNIHGTESTLMTLLWEKLEERCRARV